jgi:hypothetical protein
MGKAWLIDSAARAVREVEFREGAAINDPLSLQSLIGGYIETAWSWPNGDVLFVDEEGLLKPQRHFFRLTLRRDGLPFGGNGIVVGREVEDDSRVGYHTEPPAITREALCAIVQFLDRDQAEAWGKANASEPAGGVYGVDPDGRVRHEVFMRFGELFRDMPEPGEDEA